MCIRDSAKGVNLIGEFNGWTGNEAPMRVLGSTGVWELFWPCLLYTSDAADERSSVDLGGRRIIKKKKLQ